MSSISKGHYIAGNWIQGHGVKFSSLSPTDSKTIWEGHCATSNDIDSAVKAAKEAFYSWSMLSISERSAYLDAFVNVLKDNKSNLAYSISLEIGKPLWESATEVAAMIGKFKATEQAYNERNKESIYAKWEIPLVGPVFDPTELLL